MGPTKNVKEVQEILELIDKLHYADSPNYQEVINQLLSIQNNYEMVQKPVAGGNNFVWELKKRASPLCIDLTRLDQAMRASRAQDFQEYFNNHRSMQSQNIRIGKSDIRMFQDQAP